MATVTDTGEVSATLPIQIIDKHGIEKEVEVQLTSDTATAVLDGTEISLLGSPIGPDGTVTIGGLEKIPDGALKNHSLQINITMKVE